jgi:hypothetical protein
MQLRRTPDTDPAQQAELHKPAFPLMVAMSLAARQRHAAMDLSSPIKPADRAQLQ